ncbi:P1 family peptidase [Conexibacter sp. JD483]|uniref:DmpA family aminopeptidase n=1 Tax=unclassified Conexibacter TaxID=2627773 RepID=UPI0027204E5C|nr:MULTISPECIES: P1 family peptidase [unclassified Conexibacter]MDO8187346.1 P1 family peptidase [Conexibacter sp. CPCC 205706]MDO8200521.1 P1 family peptidase [Conexibacter sp. CPCC 205762]MDR9370010.1 P1 family peptidase [Conexibacter sp. JD483]
MTDPQLRTPAGLPRARALGIPFDGRPGPLNAITDVAGLELGHATVIAGDDVRTGVTAIHPRGRSAPGDPCAAGCFALNGNGEMTGTAWVAESGTCALPITLTSTHAVGTAHAATISWVAEHAPELAELWLLPIAAETWDGRLNALDAGAVTEAVVHAALDDARGGAIEEGSVGGGTGMVAYGFKGGAGSASRLVEVDGAEHVVGAYVQANFGAPDELLVAGVPVGRELGDALVAHGAVPPAASTAPTAPAFGTPAAASAAAPGAPTAPAAPGAPTSAPSPADGVPHGAGSVIVIVATDAPLLPHQCTALARRAALGLGRSGTCGSHWSGDLALAFSTANAGAFRRGAPRTQEPAGGRLDFLQWHALDRFYAATVQAVEEAVLNALVANRTMTGKGGLTIPALPHDRVRDLLAAHGRLAATAPAAPPPAQAAPAPAQAAPATAQAAPTTAQAAPTTAQAAPTTAQAAPRIAPTAPDLDTTTPDR